ncbi:MAG: hypothetical protein WA990_00045 [Rubrobacteraceae bacterium]
MISRLLGLGALYGFVFAIVKSLFPTPIILLILQSSESGEGNLTTLALTYMAAGLIGGLVATPIYASLLLIRRGSRTTDNTSFGTRFTLSIGLSLLMGLISSLLIIGAYAIGLLPSGGVLDPLSLINSSQFAPGTPLLVAWTIARDLLPAGLTGLFLAPIGGGPLYRFYTARRHPDQKHHVFEEEV